jgi:mannose-6-phosphate isomerase
MTQSTPLYPLLFEPIYKEKVWGGRTLEKLGRSLPGGESTKIGESWELVDLAQTSVSGGGGGAAHSTVANGPVAGKTLGALIASHGRAILGDLRLNEASGGFPLLVKFLDARENLSVQVHPSPAYAAGHPDAFLKSEAWYIVECDPGAKIYKGIRPGVTPEQMRTALKANSDEAVVPLMIDVPVRPGDCHYLPSGTCHALGAGVLVAEVQTPSDTTFRVYDWGRVGRELHVEQALACIDFGPPDVSKFEVGTTIEGSDTTVTHLVRCEFFHIDRVLVRPGVELAVGRDQPIVWMVLEGGATLTCEAGPQTKTPVGRGQTLLLPPGMTGGRARFEQPAKLLEVTFPHASPPRIA